ncbi:50S ribosome-binding GTPase [Candidatus Woesearchaeota archaeon]|nr:50S ribosome-binding GTPase [Candidatus Woesearchaeota archaeon]
MPINAHPEYFKAEEKYNKATTIPEKLTALEEMLRVGPNHKSAENLRAEIKSKISKLREQLEKNRQTKGSSKATFTVKKEGAAQVILASVTNAGKSSLLATLTNAKPLVAEYKFTTTRPEHGILNYHGILIQLIELPGIFEGCAYKGEYPTFFGMVRSTDLVIFLIDPTLNESDQIELLQSEFEKAQIKLNAKRPKVFIKRQGTGGIEYMGARYFKFDLSDATKMLITHGYHNAVVTAFEDVSLEDLADVLNESIVYLPLLIIRTKSDIKGDGISTKTKKNIEKLKDEIFQTLKLIRVYTKSPGKKHDWPPVALHDGDKIVTLAKVIHKDFIKRFSFSRIWGKSAKHDGQKVGLEHDLMDEDIVEIHTK